jgi:hypothetical protein
MMFIFDLTKTISNLKIKEKTYNKKIDFHTFFNFLKKNILSKSQLIFLKINKRQYFYFLMLPVKKI